MRLTSLALILAGFSTAFILPNAAHSDTIGGGTVAGTFVNPSPTCPPAACTGVGTSQIYWGTADPDSFPSSLAFSGRGFSTPLGTPFVMGNLQFQNGSTAAGTELNNVDLKIQTSSPLPAFSQTLSLGMTIVSTSNLGADPRADADYVYFTNFPQFGSFRVFEGATTSVELIGRFTPLDFQGFGGIFQLVGFGEVTGPNVGFTNPTISSLTAAAVPEPSTILLLATGLGTLWIRRYGRGTVKLLEQEGK